MVVHIFLAFLIFEPNLPFCKGYRRGMGYSLCKTADFQNRLISPIFAFFPSGFFYRTTLMFLQNSLSRVFGIFNFWRNLTVFAKSSLCMGYSLCKMTYFQNFAISRIFAVFPSGFLRKTILMFFQNCFSHVFSIFIF